MPTQKQIDATWKAYEAERQLWSTRNNKTYDKVFEIIRCDGEPVVMAAAIGMSMVHHELEKMRGRAAVAAALKSLNN